MPEAQHARDPYAVYDNYNPDEVSWLKVMRQDNQFMIINYD